MRPGKSLQAAVSCLVLALSVFGSAAVSADSGGKIKAGPKNNLLSERTLGRLAEVKATAKRNPAAIFVVTDPSDEADTNLSDGIFYPPTYRSAIQNTNLTPSLDEIRFAASAAVINLPSGGIPITQPVVLDGAISGVGRAVLDGTGSSPGAYGVNLSAGGCTVKNLELRNFGSGGILFGSNGGVGSVVQGCLLHHNANSGINMNLSSNNTIGGLEDEERNYIYSNIFGISLLTASNQNLIVNNFIGTLDGLTAAGNSSHGINLETIGNVISSNIIVANGQAGIECDDPTARDNLIENNYIGVDSTGLDTLPNLMEGIQFLYGMNDTIRGNIVSGNRRDGISISGDARGLVIANNSVGVDINNSRPLGNNYTGINCGGDRLTIIGNIVGGNSTGISLGGSDSSEVYGNIIGWWDAALEDISNRGTGLSVGRQGNRIGGAEVEQRNLIAGNGGYGVRVSGPFALGNVIENNYIGVNEAGTTARPNKLGGVYISQSASANFIKNNVISGNDKFGVLIESINQWSCSTNTLLGNTIGLDATMADSVPNRGHAVKIYRGRRNTIGGVGDSANVIAFADSAGIYVQRSDSNRVVGNFIGTNADSTARWGHGWDGIRIDSSKGTIVGGTNPGEGNLIAYNKGDGVGIGGPGFGNSVLGNAIFENAGQSIDLGYDGLTLNDPMDSDTGANDLLNSPVLTFYIYEGSDSTTIHGYIEGRPGTSYRVEFFTSDTDKVDQYANGEIQRYIGFADVVPNDSGMGTFVAVVDGTHPLVFATVTDSEGSTSEVGRPPIVVNLIADLNDYSSLDGICNVGGQPPVNGLPPCALRAAMEQAKAQPGLDVIAFILPFAYFHTINPDRTLPEIDQDLIIDATTQPGFIEEGGGRPLITLNGDEAESTASGLRVADGKLVVKGLSIEEFGRNGILGSTDPLEIVDCEFRHNGHHAVETDGDLRMIGLCIIDSNGVATSGDCTASIYHGVDVGGQIEADSVRAYGNCGDGLGAGSDITIHGNLTASKNAGDGVRSGGNLSVLGAEHFVNSNGEIGLNSTNGSIAVKGIADVSFNGNRLSQFDCAKGDFAGVQARRQITLEEVVADNNCGCGIFSGNTVTITGKATARNNAYHGVAATNNVLINGTAHEFSSNGRVGATSLNGTVTITGDVTAYGNGTAAGESANCLDPDATYWGGISGFKGLFITGNVTSENNCGGGLDSGGELKVTGSLLSANNSADGILSLGPVTLEGSQFEILNNGTTGISCENSTVTIRGKTKVSGNGTHYAATLPSQCQPKPIGGSEKGGIAGIWCNHLVADYIESSNNCGQGIYAATLELKGFAQVTENTGHGIWSYSIQLNSGEICNNGGYGIVLLGGAQGVSNSGKMALGTTAVCRNGSGGIFGVSGSSQASAGFATATDGRKSVFVSGDSRIRGASIFENMGDGIAWESASSLSVSGSRLFGNTGFGINNLGSAALSADNNWWGTNGGPGPGGDSTAGDVEIDQWASEDIDLAASFSGDTIYFVPGTQDTIIAMVRDWSDENREITIEISDSQGWLDEPGSIIESPGAGVASNIELPLTIPDELAARAASSLTLVVYPTGDPLAADTLTLPMSLYQPALAQIRLFPEGITLAPEDTVRFYADGLDPLGRVFDFVPHWSATGGSIDSSGVYIAGTSPGTYSVTVEDSTGALSSSIAVAIDVQTDVDDEVGTLPSQFVLGQNYPNPFNPATAIEFSLPEKSRVSLSIYNLLGQCVVRLADGIFPAGTHQIEWNGLAADGTALATGVYFYRLEAGEFRQSRKMLLLK